jgi:ketosteroid isomerase-like protein
MTDPHANPAPRSLTPAGVVKELFTFYALGDTPGMLELVHPEGECRFPGDPRIVPWAGHFTGREGARRFHRKVIDSLELEVYEAYRIEDVGPYVLVWARERCIARTTGRRFENHHLGVAVVRDSLLWRYEEYADTAAIERALVDAAREC